ncbi:MAG: ChrR family anti-sigma-E factor [Myxococcota bacterium]
MPEHHIPDDVLVAYAAGAVPAGEELLVACHLTLCPACRAAVARAEQVGESVLARAPSAPMDHALAGLMAKLDAPVPPPPARPAAPDCPWFPLPLRRRVGAHASLPWRPVGFDVRAAKVDLTSDERVFLLDFPPGFQIPTHGHHGVERTLVLQGGFRDERDSYARGDVTWRDDPDHEVRIDEDGRCTTLFVNDGAADLGWLTPLVDWWIHR